ncbi:unnamed protein product [Effrenium voratum]|nr:unnamed protein product [Effrenium voratum]
MAADLADVCGYGLLAAAPAPSFLLRRPGISADVQRAAVPAATVPAIAVDAEGEASTPKVWPADSRASSSGMVCMTYNVLLPNSQDGWWIYKYYRDNGPHTSWPARQALLEKQILHCQPDVLCLQEVSEPSFSSDFAFLPAAGYEAVLHDKKGRMRPATFWRSSEWEKVGVQHKDRTLVVTLRKLGGQNAGKTVFVVNVHLSAGPNADRRLRQVQEALDVVSKDAKKLQLEDSAVLVCGDFNSQGNSAVRELLVKGVVNADFRESGDPTEKGQEGRQVTSKTRQQKLGEFQDALDVAFAGRAPATIIAQKVDDLMLYEDGTPTPALLEAVDNAFMRCSNGRDFMNSEDIDRFLLKINRELGRGSEHRFVEAAIEGKGERRLSREDFQALYAAELAEGKFWGVEHDLRELLGSGLCKPQQGPCQLRFDYIYFTSSTLRLTGVQEPLTKAQKLRIFAEPWEVLPNSWHPSDHLPVVAAFDFAS